MQRSGTQALGSVLDQHSGIEYLGEVFHDKYRDRPSNYFGYLENLNNADRALLSPDQSPERFRRFMAHIDALTKKDVTALDVKYASTHHFEKYWKNLWAPPFFIQLLAAHQIPVIHLTRRNILKQYVSNLMAEATNVWNVKELAELDTKKIKVNTESLIAELDMRENHARLMGQYLLACPKVTTFDYAELFWENELSESVAAKLTEFLGVTDFVNRKPVFHKQNPEHLEDAISNMDDVVATIQPSRFFWMLEN